MSVVSSGLDAREYRRALSHLPTSVVVVAGFPDDRPDATPVGMVVGTFTSVSLTPPLVGFLADRGSTTFPVLRGLERLSFSVLGEHDGPLCRRLARPAEHRFNGVAWTRSVHGSPQLSTAVLTIEGRVGDCMPVGDHVLLLAEVLSVRHAARPARPLVFHAGALTPPQPAVPSVRDARSWGLDDEGVDD